MDEVGCLFEFSRAKRHLYAGSSLIWLTEAADLHRAPREATEAVKMWETEPPATRSLDGEVPAHIYAATAQAQLRRPTAALDE